MKDSGQIQELLEKKIRTGREATLMNIKKLSCAKERPVFLS